LFHSRDNAVHSNNVHPLWYAFWHTLAWRGDSVGKPVGVDRCSPVDDVVFCGEVECFFQQSMMSLAVSN